MKEVKELSTLVVYTPSKSQRAKRKLWQKGDPKSAHSVWDDRHRCW